MRILIAITLLIGTAVSAQTKPPDAAGEIRLTYLGQAGYEITDGKTVLLVDPVITMMKLRRDTTPANLNVPKEISNILTPDTEAIDSKIKRADYILITHGHYDHLLDAPYISNKTGAIIIGHETTANIARAYDVPHQKLLIVRGGEDFDFGAFSLRVIPSLHTAVAHKFYYSDPLASQLGGYAPKGLKAPLHGSGFAEGGDLMYLLRIAGHQVLIMGSMNYIEREVDGLRPDIAIVGAVSNRHEIFDYTGRLMRALGHPATVFPTHWLYCGAPAWQESMMKNVQQFAEEVKASSPQTHVVIPQCFEPTLIGQEEHQQ
jgi:L-ascorbate metabolism protein UlaG (beta-lactamase superfamily)